MAINISREQLVEAHLDHPVRIPFNRLTALERQIYNRAKTASDQTATDGNLQARIEHRSGRRAVHWREEVEKLMGLEYAEEVLATTRAGDDRDVLVIEELPPGGNSGS